jgi:exodeoxyribonuclease VII large subunit
VKTDPHQRDLFAATRGTGPRGTPPGVEPISVSQITAMIKAAIERNLPPVVYVVGEISNFKRHSSGHVYLTLKDASSELACVMWRNMAAALKFSPTDGLEVVATGSIEVFERAGRYQLYIRKLEPRGVGALELAFRQLCERLEKEGVFEQRHKQPIPRYPARMAIVTSPTGAAIQDMLRTIQRRFPCVHLLLYPVRVQGPGAAKEIAGAIRRLNAQSESLGGLDVMIVGRGGGSLEDLWAFNEEVVARAIFASRIPVISAVGHEVDVTVADLVADVRAATPTAAAELAVPVLDEVLAHLTTQASRLERNVRARKDVLAAKLNGLLQRTALREPARTVRRREQVVDELTNRMHRCVIDRVRARRGRLDRLEPVVARIAPHAYLRHKADTLGAARSRLRESARRALLRALQFMYSAERRLERATPFHRTQLLAERVTRLSAMLPSLMRHRVRLLNGTVGSIAGRLEAGSHRRVLSRGYSVTRTKKGRKVVRSVRDLEDRQRLVTELADGAFDSEVINLEQLELFE